jgi:hypothetical protein
MLPHFNNDCFAHLKIFRRNLPFLQWSELISLQSSVDIEKNQPPHALAQPWLNTKRHVERRINRQLASWVFGLILRPRKKEDQ